MAIWINLSCGGSSPDSYNASCLPDRFPAAIIRARDTLGLTTGTLITIPVPQEHELPAPVAESAIAQALQEATRHGVRGKEVTPFLLARVSELTHEKSRTANVALLKNNARLAAQIARALTK